MLKFYFQLVVLTIFVFCLGSSYEIKERLNSQIDHVTILQNVAEIERHHVTNMKEINPLDKSTHTLQLDGFSNLMDVNSLRIEASDFLNILDYGVYEIPMIQDGSNSIQDIKDLEAKKMDLKTKLSNLNLKVQNSQNKLSLINKSFENLIVSPSNNNNDLVSLLNKVESFTKNVETDITKYEKEILLTNNELTQVELTLNTFKIFYKDTLQVIKKEKRVIIHFMIDSTANTKLTNGGFYFKYLTSSNPVQWQPQFDLSLDSLESTQNNKIDEGVKSGKYSLKINYYAKISQDTGEQWSNVTLTLSTVYPQYFQPFISTEKKFLYAHQPQPILSRAGGRAYISNANNFDGNTMEAASDTVMFASFSKKSAGRPQAVVFESGDLQVANKYEIMHPITIPSSRHHQDNQLVLIDRIEMTSEVFSFYVPSQRASKPYLTLLTKLPKDSIKLMQCNDVNIRIQGHYLGKTTTKALFPDDPVLMNIGDDETAKVDVFEVHPINNNVEEDKSTWFYVDKKKFRVQSHEKIITVKNMNPLNENNKNDKKLIIVSENVPKSTEEKDIKLELVYPETQDMLQLNPSKYVTSTMGKDESMLTEEEYLLYLAQQELHHQVSSPTIPIKSTEINVRKNDGQPVKILISKAPYYYSKSTGNIYWVLRLSPQEEVNLSLKYKIIVPEDKSFYLSN